MWEERPIGCFYDCDKTLISVYMQQALAEHYGFNLMEFLDEADDYAKQRKAHGVNIDFENSYMIMMVKYVQRGIMPDLSNAKLRELGQGIDQYAFPGLPDVFGRTKRLIEENGVYADNKITVEHYIPTTGLKEMVLGSKLNGSLTDVFGGEFDEENGVIAHVARSVGYMKKTDFLHQCNKGTNHNPNVNIQERMGKDVRRIPFNSMKFVGDGETDVPCMVLIGDRGGDSYGVYNPSETKAKAQAQKLFMERRTKGAYPANYEEGSEFSKQFEQDLLITADRRLWEIQNL
jgi:hypothetical protein